MKPDTLVFDIETQNFFTDPDVGWNNFEALKISVVGVYSYARDEYQCFEEHEMQDIMRLFEGASRIVGFSINRFDVPVLQRYFLSISGSSGSNLWVKDRIDILEEIEAATGSRISLDRLAQANLGEEKSGHGSDAAKLYRDGKIKELKEYCLRDVNLTKRLYDMYLKDKALLVPDKATGETKKVVFGGGVQFPSQAGLL